MRTMTELLQIPAESRDIHWEDEFLTRLSEGKVGVLSPDPVVGPDQWPYLLIATDQEQESAQKILSWLSERGIGLVVNPSKDYPDFVLTYGMIWNFRETGRFIDRRVPTRTDATTDLTEVEVVYSAETLKIAGPPTDQYLPPYVRSILRQFFRDQGVHQPRVQVLSVDEEQFDLALSLESLGNPPEREHAGIAEAVSWFLPPHYNIVLVDEKNLPPFTVL